MYTKNADICAAVTLAANANLRVMHQCSCPAFEQHHGMEVPSKDKPFAACRVVQANANTKASVLAALRELLAQPGERRTQCFEPKIRAWAQANAAGEPAYRFDN
jgi:hypothetical protein